MNRLEISMAALLLVGCSETDETGVWDTAADEPGGESSAPGSATGDATADGDASSSSAEASSGGPEGATSGPVLDVGDQGPPPGVECDCGNDAWSYIWVANSFDGTVSKINTDTLVEEGRYITRPDRDGNPSRTSVSVNGRAVAVANRHGGLTKIWARETFCDPMANGVPGVQTSTGPQDVLPWGEDDCVDWYVASQWSTQRPVAWSGRLDETNCEDEAVWTAGCSGGFQPGFGDAFADVEVQRIDGASGDVLDEVTIDGFSCSGFGPYGGAVAPDGKLWLVINNGGLASVDPDTLETEVFVKDPSLSPYGLTVDRDGFVWVSSYAGSTGAGRLDPASGDWLVATGFSGQGGIGQSLDGRIWTTDDAAGLVWLDPETAQLGGSIPIPDGSVKGVSGDVHGNVWAVAGAAHKIDTTTDTIVGSYGNLIGPYTYSDMTGAGIQNVACDPEG